MLKIRKFIEVCGNEDAEIYEDLLIRLLTAERDSYRNIGDAPALRVADAAETVLRALMRGYDAED